MEGARVETTLRNCSSSGLGAASSRSRRFCSNSAEAVAAAVLPANATGGAEEVVVVPDGDDGGTEAVVDGVSGTGVGADVDGTGAAGAFRSESSGAGWCFAT